MKGMFIMILVLATSWSMLLGQVNQHDTDLIDRNLDSVVASELVKSQSTVIVFWATWSKPDIMLLTTINDRYQKWQEQFGVKVLAVSIDDINSFGRVLPFVKSKDWSFDILLDPEMNYMRKFDGANSNPVTVICKKGGEVVKMHHGYAKGDVDEIEKELGLLPMN